MRLTSGVRRSLAVVVTAAVFPAFAVASRALAPGGEAALHQRVPTLKLQPLMDRLGLRPVGAVAAELKAGEKVRATVVDPRKLARVGMRGTRAGDVVWIAARLPAAQAGDAQQASQSQEAAGEAAKQAQSAAQAGSGGLDAEVSSNGKKVVVPSSPPSGGTPTTTI